MLRLDHCFAQPRRLLRSQIGSANLRSAMNRRVDIVAAEPGVAIGREHLEDALVQFEDRDVERAAAEIEDRDLRFVSSWSRP